MTTTTQPAVVSRVSPDVKRDTDRAAELLRIAAMLQILIDKKMGEVDFVRAGFLQFRAGGKTFVANIRACPGCDAGTCEPNKEHELLELVPLALEPKPAKSRGRNKP